MKCQIEKRDTISRAFTIDSPISSCNSKDSLEVRGGRFLQGIAAFTLGKRVRGID